MDIPTKALGETIRALREQALLTQEDLGAGAEYGKGAAVSISRIENGRTRPGPERLARIAKALGLTEEELHDRAMQRTKELEQEAAEEIPFAPYEAVRGRGRRRSGRSTKQRLESAQHRIGERMAAVQQAGDAFNAAHDRARDEFFMPFVQSAAQVIDAPEQPDPAAFPPEGDDSPGSLTVAASPNARTGWTAYRGALLTGIVASPAAMLGVGGLVWLSRRNKAQEAALALQLDEAEAVIIKTQPAFHALIDVLPRAAAILDYVAIHAGHACRRWEVGLPPAPISWSDMRARQQQSYLDFTVILGCQISVANLRYEELLTAQGDEWEQLAKAAREMLAEAKATVEALV